MKTLRTVAVLLTISCLGYAADLDPKYLMRVSPPGAWQYWFLVPNANRTEAKASFVFQADATTSTWFQEHSQDAGFIKVDDGTSVRVITSEDSDTTKVSVLDGPNAGSVGWIDPRVLKLTSESEQAKARDDAAQAASDAKDAEQERQAAITAKKKAQAAAAAKLQAAADVEARYQADLAAKQKRLAELREREQQACYAIYAETADKKVSNLTVKQDQEVRACQHAGMYYAP